MKYRIQHNTHYLYSQPLLHSVHELRLTPPDMAWQQVKSWQIKVPGNLTRTLDGFGNWVETFTVQGSVDRPLQSVHIEAEGVVDVENNLNPPYFEEKTVNGAALVSPYYYLGITPLTELSPTMRTFAQAYLTPEALAQDTGLAVLSLSQAITQRVAYTSSSTDVGTSAIESFNQGQGVCQDHAHIMLACCRAFGVPARYVSGYFYDAEASNLASHAWVDVCLDVANYRWASIDVTHNCFTDNRHIRLAVGRDYQGAAPIRGVRQGGGDERMQVKITISPVDL